MTNNSALLQQGISILGLPVTHNNIDKLLVFAELLQKWNKTYNLTGAKDITEIINKHILDSLAIVPYIKGNMVLDVGTGAGFPGIPLALILLDKQFVLLDSNNKKTHFLTYVLTKLEITNVQIINDRVEKFSSEDKFDIIVTRAFSSLNNFIAKTKHLCANNGHLLAMTGKQPKTSYLTNKLNVPFLNAERHVILMPRELL